MHAVPLILSVGLLLLAVVDLLWTTLWVDGSAGPLTRRLAMALWGGLRTVGGQGSRTLSLAGPLILTATLLCWVGLLWAGWTLLYASDPGSLIDTRADEPVTWTGRAWFAAYTMFTVGNGDFTPRDGAWQVVASLTAASGMLFVTMGASYVVSVLGAVAQKRSFASSVAGLGGRPGDVVAAGWGGEDLHALDLPLSSLTSQLGLLTDQHQSYPVLHYYHSEGREDASSAAVATLDEALTLLCFGVPEHVRPNRALLREARSNVRSYLDTLASTSAQTADHDPPAPDLRPLRAAGVPTDDGALADALADLASRRRRLLGMVRADAWDWDPGS